MKKILLLIACLPLLAKAQQPGDTTIKNPVYLNQPIGSVSIHGGQFDIKPIKQRELYLGGIYTASAAAKLANGPIYNNDIIKDGSRFGHSLYLKAAIKRDYTQPIWNLSLNASQSTENLVLPNNKNTSNALGGSIERVVNKAALSGGYNIYTAHFTNSNQYGYLNQLYENALTTPFNQPYTIPVNPYPGEHQKQQTAFFNIHQNSEHLTIQVNSSLDATNNKIAEPNYSRNQDETHYRADASGTYRLRIKNVNSTAGIKYLYNDDEVHIDDPGNTYHYSRSTNEGIFSYDTRYYFNETSTGLKLANKFYQSSTTTNPNFFLPEISAFVLQSDIDDHYFSSARLAFSYSAFYSEPSLNHPWSSFLLTQLLPQQAANFMPTIEVQSFNNLSPVRHQEFTTKADLTIWYWLTASADLAFRTNKDNPYPVYVDNQLILKNLAGTRYRSLELTLNQNPLRLDSGIATIFNSISFWRYTNTVTQIADDQDSLPIAGFANIHNTLIKGRPLGIITGGPQHAIIGNPTPDYTIKFSHQLNLKKLTLAADWQFRKGGDVWNGTQSVLDYNHTGTAESYIEKADNIRINLLSLAYTIPLKRPNRQIRLLAYAENLLVWSAYKGVDPQQRLFDQADASGLDFFNLPSTKTFGVNASLQF